MYHFEKEILQSLIISIKKYTDIDWPSTSITSSKEHGKESPKRPLIIVNLEKVCNSFSGRKNKVIYCTKFINPDLPEEVRMLLEIMIRSQKSMWKNWQIM